MPLPDDPSDAARRRAARREKRRRRLDAMGAGAWRLFPFRGRFLSASTTFVFERLPEAPATWSASDVALLCVEADRTLELDAPCDPAEIVDLLTSRGMATWTDGGFVKTDRRAPKRPRA